MFSIVTLFKYNVSTILSPIVDGQPFCEALEKMCAFWKDKKIDMLRQGISIPGVTLTYLFTPWNLASSLCLTKKIKIYTPCSRKIWLEAPASSPTDIMKKTRPRSERERVITDQGKGPKMRQKIVGYDTNALYLLAIKTCPPDLLRDDAKKPTSKKKAPPRWPPSG